MFEISSSTIIANLEKLVEAIDFDSLKPHLVKNGVYTESLLKAAIGDGSQHPTKQKQNFLFGLKQKNPEGLSNFVQSLIDAEQFEAVKILIPNFEKPLQELQTAKEESNPMTNAKKEAPSYQPVQTCANYVPVWDVAQEVLADTLPEIKEFDHVDNLKEGHDSGEREFWKYYYDLLRESPDEEKTKFHVEFKRRMRPNQATGNFRPIDGRCKKGSGYTTALKNVVEDVKELADSKNIENSKLGELIAMAQTVKNYRENDLKRYENPDDAHKNILAQWEKLTEELEGLKQHANLRFTA